MTTTERNWPEIFRAAEDPVAPPIKHPRDSAEPEEGALWAPSKFDYAAASTRFRFLARRIEQVYGCECPHGCSVTYGTAAFGSIVIPAEATRTRSKRTRLPFAVEVLVSTFGWLATCWPADAAMSQAVTVHADDRARIQPAIEDLGYLFVPEEELGRPYDGVNDWLVTGPFGKTDATWFDRYFYDMLRP